VNCDAMELEQQTKFDLLVRQLEKSTRQRTTAKYQLRVAALAAIGYGYIGIIFMSIFSSLWMVRWLLELTQKRPITIDPNQLWILFGLVTISTFWVQPTPLSDREINQTEFPELFTVIDRLSGELNAPKIHHVVVNYEHNAAIYQTPHFGWREWHHNYLILGLPLLQSLTPLQLEATLAHELGHLSNHDSTFTSYIIRVRRMWEQLTADNNLFILQWFFRWYEPLIKAYSFVSVRDREYAADAMAKRMTSPEVAAHDLIQTYIYQYYLQECFSRQLDRQARESPTPPPDVVTQMLAALRQPLDPQVAQVWLGLILGQATDTDDTHPCLSDRLAAVGYPIPTSWAPQPIERTAAEHFFGDGLADLAAGLDRQWSENRKSAWLRQYQHAQYQQAYLDTLNDRATIAPLSVTEATIQADLTGELDGDPAAFQLWQEILVAHPDRARANYQVGRILVNRGHFSGCMYLERAIELEPDLVVPSCEDLYRFHTLQGDFTTAETYLAWRQQHLPKQWRSKLERTLKATDRFIPHDLESDLVAEICQKLINHSAIARAYLVCKPLQVFPARPLYILAIEIANPRSTNNRQKLAVAVELERDLSDRLQIELNFERQLLIAFFDRKKSVFTNDRDWKLLENIQSTPNAIIFQ
jgi:Zn-dependent protease with chaperone function